VNFEKKIFSLGSIPMSQSTLFQYGFWSYFFWWILQKSPMLEHTLYIPYRMKIDHLFENKAISLQEQTTFTLKKIRQNPNLTAEQRDDVIASLSVLIGNESTTTFARMTLVFLGILKFSKPSITT
jgi:hypothetical protein